MLKNILKNKALMLLGLMMLTACQPVYKTDYAFIPPATASGKICAQNCQTSRLTCMNACAGKQQECRMRQQSYAMGDYDSYVRMQGISGRPAVRTERDFARRYPCYPEICEENCITAQRSCHASCGGQEVPHTYCTANCN